MMESSFVLIGMFASLVLLMLTGAGAVGPSGAAGDAAAWL